MYGFFLRAYVTSVDALADRGAFERAYASLPAFRRKRVDGLSNESVRRQSAAAFALLVHGLRDIGLDVDLASTWDELGYVSDERGKPRFEGRPDLFFSLSHAKDMAACVMSGAECGCDLERMDRMKDMDAMRSVASMVCTQREMDAIFDSEHVTRAFFETWTRKEAYVKFTGNGLAGMADEPFDVERVDACFHTLDIDDHVFSICLPSGHEAAFENLMPETVRF